MLRSIALSAVCVLLAAACSTESITVRSSLNARNVTVYYSEAAKDGVIRTEIVGNPLNVPDAEWIERITGVFNTAHFGPEFEFSTDAVVDRITYARIVVQFQPPATTTARTICGGIDTLEPSVATDAGRLEAVAALCVQDNALDWAVVTGPMPASLEDARLVQFASAIAQNIVRPNVRDHNGCNNSNCS